MFSFIQIGFATDGIFKRTVELYEGTHKHV